MEPFKYDEVRSAKGQCAAGQNSTEVTIPGNVSYNLLVGYMVVVMDANGLPYTGNVDVAMNTTQGVALLPLQPYHCIRPSFQEKFEDRIHRLNDVKGNGQDFKFRIDRSNPGDALNISVVGYFTRRK